jgi:hypothetical protein
MTVEDIFNNYSDKIAQLHLYQRAMKELATAEIKKLNEYAVSFSDKPEILELSSSYNNMYFYAARDGEAKLYAHKKSSVEDRIESVYLHKNKQYQWLLAEIYEVYEDFLEEIYAYIGSKDNSLWPLIDFGNVRLSDLKNKDFEYYLTQAKKKDDIPHSILNSIRQSFPDYYKLETENKLNKNIRLLIVLVEKLRHIIVHCGGVVKDKKEFIELVIRKAGFFNDGKYKKEYYDFIEGFFGAEQYSTTISLLEIRVMPELPILAEVDRFEILSNILSASAYAICEEINKKKMA